MLLLVSLFLLSHSNERLPFLNLKRLVGENLLSTSTLIVLCKGILLSLSAAAHFTSLALGAGKFCVPIDLKLGVL